MLCAQHLGPQHGHGATTTSLSQAVAQTLSCCRITQSSMSTAQTLAHTHLPLSTQHPVHHRHQQPLWHLPVAGIGSTPLLMSQATEASSTAQQLDCKNHPSSTVLVQHPVQHRHSSTRNHNNIHNVTRTSVTESTRTTPTLAAACCCYHSRVRQDVGGLPACLVATTSSSAVTKRCCTRLLESTLVPCMLHSTLSSHLNCPLSIKGFTAFIDTTMGPQPQPPALSKYCSCCVRRSKPSAPVTCCMVTQLQLQVAMLIPERPAMSSCKGFSAATFT